jgi:hypothetical protein
MSTPTVQEIHDILQKFQDGYDRRDPSLIEDFRKLFVPEGELEVIGTGAVTPGEDEWCLGLDSSCDLFTNDWEAWGDLTLDVADSRVSSLGDVAWLSATGTVKMTLDPEEMYTDYLDTIQSISVDEELDPKQRLIEILRSGTNTLFEAERGREYIWPLRFTAVLVRREGNWLFAQVQFSFATTRFPDVRNV